LQVTQLACAIGAVALLPCTGGLVRNLSDASGGAIAALCYLGLIPTALAFGTWAFALSRMTAGRLGVTTYLVPPLTILLAWPLLGEAPPPLALAGGAIALVGIAVSRRR
jgi:drug/metabolite transporter (DMT)-like permease